MAELPNTASLRTATFDCFTYTKGATKTHYV